LRDDARAHDLTIAVDVPEKGVERLHPLLEPVREPAPFVGREDAGNNVEGDEPLLRRLLAVDGEGDADAAEQKLRLLAPLIKQVRRRIVEPLFQRLIAGLQPSPKPTISSKAPGFMCPPACAVVARRTNQFACQFTSQ